MPDRTQILERRLKESIEFFSGLRANGLETILDEVILELNRISTFEFFMIEKKEAIIGRLSCCVWQKETLLS